MNVSNTSTLNTQPDQRHKLQFAIERCTSGLGKAVTCCETDQLIKVLSVTACLNERNRSCVRAIAHMTDPRCAAPYCFQPTGAGLGRAPLLTFHEAVSACLCLSRLGRLMKRSSTSLPLKNSADSCQCVSCNTITSQLSEASVAIQDLMSAHCCWPRWANLARLGSPL